MRKRRGLLALAAVTVLLIVAGFVVINADTQRPWYGTPNPTNLPTGGISQEMATDIALGDTVLPSDWQVWAGASQDFDTERWVWQVWYGYVAGPTSGYGHVVVIDFFSGEVLDRRDWIS